MTLDLNQIHAIRIEFETYHTGIFLLRFSIHVIDDEEDCLPCPIGSWLTSTQWG